MVDRLFLWYIRHRICLWSI